MERQIIEAAVADFRRRYDSSAAIRRLLEKVESGTATYADAQDYVRETMSLQTAIWETWLFPADLPDDEARRRVAAQLTRNVLDENYELVSAYARQVQQELNRKAGIGLKAQRAKQNRSRAEGLVQVASDPDRQAQLPALAENYARSIVDSTVKTNADFQYKAGLRPKIRRMTDGKCCEWCSRLAGVYDYPDVPKDVFRRHANCGCVVEYDPGDGKNVRNVHTKQVRSEEERGKIEMRRSVGNYSNAKRRYEEDVFVPLGVGAKQKDILVKLPDGSRVILTPGSRITHVQTIAGLGRKRQIDIVDLLTNKYRGTDALKWQKKKGIGYVDFDGESYKAELHWYEEPSVGRVEFKIKPDADGNWFYEDE